MVLPAYDVVRLERAHRAEHLELLVADRSRGQRRRRLHRHERQHLHQVGDDHVAERAGRLVERRPHLEAERLRHVDLDVVDEVAVPDRLEQAVGEAERQDVLRRLLAEEVVDAEDLLLAEHLVQARVELARRLEVGAERLLHDDPRPLDQAGLGELAHDGQRGLRRHAEVVQPADLAVALRASCFSASATASASACGPSLCRTKVSRPAKSSQHDSSNGLLNSSIPSRASFTNCSVSRSSSDVPTIRQSRSSPASKRCSRPGSSLRRARSPVAPNSTTTCGCSMHTIVGRTRDDVVTYRPRTPVRNLHTSCPRPDRSGSYARGHGQRGASTGAGRRGRADHQPGGHGPARRRGLRRPAGVRRTGGRRSRRPVDAAPAGARRDAARLRRPRGVPPGAGRPAGAGADADRPGRRDRPARRARGRRRRLPDQAVQHARAGGPGPGAAAPRRPGRRARLPGLGGPDGRPRATSTGRAAACASTGSTCT